MHALDDQAAKGTLPYCATQMGACQNEASGKRGAQPPHTQAARGKATHIVLQQSPCYLCKHWARHTCCRGQPPAPGTTACTIKH